MGYEYRVTNFTFLILYQISNIYNHILDKIIVLNRL